MEPDLSLVDPVDLNLARRNTIGDALTRSADRRPETIAVIDGARRFTYAQLDRDAEALARGLIALPDAPAHGEPVAVLMTNAYEFFVAYFGIVKAGRVALPVNYGLSPEDIGWILGDAGVRCVIADAALLPLTSATGHDLTTLIVHGPVEGETASAGIIDFADLIAGEVTGELRLIIGSDDVAQCLYTSGTTANPKGALSSHSSVVMGAMSNALLLGDNWGRAPGTMLVVLPLFHVTALNAMSHAVLFVGGTLVLQQGFDPAAVLDAIEAEGVTDFVGLPMMWAALIAENDRRPRDLGSMVSAVYAMAQMPERILAGMDAMMPNAAKRLGSGQTEVIPMTTFQRPHHREAKNGSWGIPSPTVRTRIMDPAGEILPVGEVGEIVYRSGQVTSGYWNRPEANAEAFRHGWFHSGDVGWIDEEGVVWFTDRVKDIIKTGGENVSSMKVERVIADAPGVVECSVVGVADPRWGEAVTAVVLTDRLPDREAVSEADYVAAEESLAAGILAHARDHLAGFEVPKHVEFVDALPKTTTGKIRKHLLRNQL